MSICRMGESGVVIRLAHAQWSVITEDGEQGFSKTGPMFLVYMESKKTSNDQELIQSDPISCPQNQKGNN